MTRNPDTDGAALLLLTPLTVPTERNLSSISHQTLLFVCCETVPAPVVNQQPPKRNRGNIIVTAYQHTAHTATETPDHPTGTPAPRAPDTANSAADTSSHQHPHSSGQQQVSQQRRARVPGRPAHWAITFRVSRNDAHIPGAAVPDHTRPNSSTADT